MLIASALWGVVRPDDPIPAYRLSMGARLPRLGPLPAFWRPALRAALPDGGLVVDLRSGPYAAAWTPRDAEVVSVRAFTERAGRRTAVSHMVKARAATSRGCCSPRPSRRATPRGVAELVAAAGLEVELADGTLDVLYRAA